MGRFVVEPVDDSENRTRGKTRAEYSPFKPLKFAPARPAHAQPPDRAKSGERSPAAEHRLGGVLRGLVTGQVMRPRHAFFR